MCTGSCGIFPEFGSGFPGKPCYSCGKGIRIQQACYCRRSGIKYSTSRSNEKGLPPYRRLAGEATPVGPVEVVIVEGLHLFCTPAVADQFDIKVFVDTPADIRFIRRLIRDQAERGRTWDSVVSQYLGTVRPAHLRQIEPSRTEAELVILDEAGAVRLEDETAVERLIAPLLTDPRLKSIIE